MICQRQLHLLFFWQPPRKAKKVLTSFWYGIVAQQWLLSFLVAKKTKRCKVVVWGSRLKCRSICRAESKSGGANDGVERVLVSPQSKNKVSGHWLFLVGCLDGLVLFCKGGLVFSTDVQAILDVQIKSCKISGMFAAVCVFDTKPTME